MIRHLVLLILSILLFTSCQSDDDACVFDPETKPIAIEFTMLQDSLMNITSKTDLVKLLSRYPVIRDFTFRRDEFPDDSLFINELFNRFTNPHLDTLHAETTRVFGDGSKLRSEFEEAFANLTYYHPEFKAPKVVTVMSGLLGTDLMVTDSLIVVSLDFFLGAGAKYRPKMYEYLLRKYDPNDIVPSCLLIFGISDAYNKNQPKDQTVLADMLAYGKAFYFAKHMLPCVADSVFIWYTPEEISGARKNEDLIWARFIESEVLYSTNKKVKQDYLGERPVTIQVGEKCPGRIGQWVGWQIINKYVETHPDRKLPEIMAMDNAEKILKESRYKPD